MGEGRDHSESEGMTGCWRRRRPFPLASRERRSGQSEGGRGGVPKLRNERLPPSRGADLRSSPPSPTRGEGR
ncbi:hypothetical protein A33M_1155 [Rhodovulum sp. PH10]|nr:hypothetical protein A33M_1155 [Rhodovulum sp. PH10]